MGTSLKSVNALYQNQITQILFAVQPTSLTLQCSSVASLVKTLLKQFLKRHQAQQERQPALLEARLPGLATLWLALQTAQPML